MIPPDTQALLDDLHACEVVLGDWREERGWPRGLMPPSAIDNLTDVEVETIGRLMLEIERAKRALQAYLESSRRAVLGDVVLGLWPDRGGVVTPMLDGDQWPWPYRQTRHVVLQCVFDPQAYNALRPATDALRLYTPGVIIDRVVIDLIALSRGSARDGERLEIECREVLEAKPVRWESEYNQRPYIRDDLCPLPAGHRGRCRPDPTEPHGGAIRCGRPIGITTPDEAPVTVPIACGRPIERAIVEMADRYRDERNPFTGDEARIADHLVSRERDR